MGAPTSSYATAGIVLRVSGALKPHHHDKVETPSVGKDIFLNLYKYGQFTWITPGNHNGNLHLVLKQAAYQEKELY
jgi:hypothetical protein